MTGPSATTTEEAEALSSELLAIADATEGDHVRAEVVGIDCPDDPSQLRLTVRLPHGERETFGVEKPVPWDTEFTLAGIMEDHGLGPANVEMLLGEDVLVERDGGDWTLVNPASGSVDWIAVTGGALCLGIGQLSVFVAGHDVAVDPSGAEGLVFIMATFISMVGVFLLLTGVSGGDPA